MKKIAILLFIMTIFLFAKSDVATKDDIRVLSNKIDKLSEQIDKRFEQMQHNMDKRFEQVDKRFEQMQHNMDKRFEQIDKRFEQMQHNIDKRFEETRYYMDREFTIMQYWVGAISTALFGIFFYLMKEHKLLKDSISKELKEELKKKADKKEMEQIVLVIEEFAKKDKTFREILEKHHLKYVA